MRSAPPVCVTRAGHCLCRRLSTLDVRCRHPPELPLINDGSSRHPRTWPSCRSNRTSARARRPSCNLRRQRLRAARVGLGLQPQQPAHQAALPPLLLQAAQPSAAAWPCSPGQNMRGRVPTPRRSQCNAVAQVVPGGTLDQRKRRSTALLAYIEKGSRLHEGTTPVPSIASPRPPDLSSCSRATAPASRASHGPARDSPRHGPAAGDRPETRTPRGPGRAAHP